MDAELAQLRAEIAASKAANEAQPDRVIRKVWGDARCSQDVGRQRAESADTICDSLVYLVVSFSEAGKQD
jgi:glucose-6-phosphate dehydrogenase assembly protein OpcA